MRFELVASALDRQPLGPMLASRGIMPCMIDMILGTNGSTTSNDQANQLTAELQIRAVHSIHCELCFTVQVNLTPPFAAPI